VSSLGVSAQCVQGITLEELSRPLVLRANRCRKSVVCCTSVQQPSAAQHMLRRTRDPLPFLFRAAAAGKRCSSGEAESEWDRLDLTHFFFLVFFFVCAFYASTLLNSRTRRSTTTLLIRSPARTDVCPHRSRQGVERCRHRRCSKKSLKRVWRSKSITGAIAIRAFSRTQFLQISARWRVLMKSENAIPLAKAIIAFTRDRPR
jgi:hypothetical protein